MSGKKIVLFGAGKIGRSFIGQLFSCSGFEVVFADVNQQLVDNLNKYRKYKVVINSEDGDEVL
jgi:mannitol-1-phosphate 5-dehydrogenase